MENLRVKQKYLEIKEENHEILERIGEISNILILNLIILSIL